MTRSNKEAVESSIGFQYLMFSPNYYYQDVITVTSKGIQLSMLKILKIFTSVDLSDNHLVGQIPSSIGYLDSLHVLNMSLNALAGPVPPQLGNLTQLESLDLSKNNLSGDIPPELASLNFLSVLDLSYNNLVGKIPVGGQFSTFSNSSFKGNEGLCGIPLAKQCNIPSFRPSSTSGKPVKRATINPNWEYIFTGLGFGGGLAMLIGTILVWEEGRRLHDSWVDDMMEIFFHFSGLWNGCGDGRVSDMEGMEDDSEEIDDAALTTAKFCVYCTELYFCEGLMKINRVECSCRVGAI